MFDAPADAWYVWLGVAIVSVAVTGIALELPSEPPPDATAAANAVDRSAGSTYDATATYDHGAAEVRFDDRGLSLRNAGGAAHASVAFGPITPVTVDDDLAAVLNGEAPKDRFRNPKSFADAAEHAQIGANDRGWRSASGTLRVRTVTWGDVRVTLVDA